LDIATFEQNWHAGQRTYPHPIRLAKLLPLRGQNNHTCAVYTAV
jgi:hypothetical protein